MKHFSELTKEEKATIHDILKTVACTKCGSESNWQGLRSAIIVVATGDNTIEDQECIKRLPVMAVVFEDLNTHIGGCVSVADWLDHMGYSADFHSIVAHSLRILKTMVLKYSTREENYNG